jgi:hypothetical protein
MKNAAQWDTEAIERLKELGLTEYDAKVYYTLVAKSPLTAIDISREADVPMSKIYVVLSRLENGGWISVVPERPKQYRAVDPSITVDNACSMAVGRLENTRSLLQKSLKETFDKKTGDAESSEFLVVHGTVNALNHLKEIIQSQKAGITIIAAFANARTVERISDLVKDYSGPKRLFIINEKKAMGQYAGLLPHLPYATAMEVGEKWHDGIVFLYTKGSGMYATVEGDDFKMALIIRDRGLLELMKTFIEGAHHPAIKLEPDSPDSHVAMLAAHKAKAAETFGKLISKHK